MKLVGRDAQRFCDAPPPACIGALLTGEDAGLVAARRRALVAALMGDALDDLRLTQLDAAEARRDPAVVDEALRARGFFPGRRVVVIEGGTDGLAQGLGRVLDGITADDAFLIVTATTLPGRSSLRKLFETDAVLACLTFRTTGPDPDEIADRLARRGLRGGVTPDAARRLAGIAADMDHGSFEQFLEVVALRGIDADGPLGEAEIAALAPAGLEADTDRFVEVVADGRPSELAPLLRRLRAGGATPVGLLIALQRHFRILLTAAAADGGPEAGLARLRPPLWGQRREMVLRQLRKWNGNRLEQACRLLFDADARARSSSAAPDFALIERSALRLAMMAQR